MPSSSASVEQEGQIELPPLVPKSELPPIKEIKESSQGFTLYDIFFWRDAPDWYYKTFQSAGFGLCYCALKQYLNRHELEVFMPPRSKVLPEAMQRGYRNSQMLKYAFLKVGKEVTTIAGAAAVYYAGAFYVGKYRDQHTWSNFAASGAAAGAGVSLWLIHPIKLRPTLFGVALGGMLGGAGAFAVQALGYPLWDLDRDFEGYFLGQKINLKKKQQTGSFSSSSNSANSVVNHASATAES